MLLHKENTESALDTKELKQTIRKGDRASKRKLRTENDKWKQHQALKKCADYNEVSYWKVVSHCTRL